VRLNERIIDGNYLNFVVLNGMTESEASNATEAVDSHFYRSHGTNCVEKEVPSCPINDKYRKCRENEILKPPETRAAVLTT
jgi:hypothetical protein